LNLIEPCITRGVRALVGVPKLVAWPKLVFLVCLMIAVQVFPAAVQPKVGLGLTWAIA
jgi:hypothetical protein